LIATGILAKEVVVGTLDSLYSSIDTEEGVNESKVSEYSLKDGLIQALTTIPVNLNEALQNISRIIAPNAATQGKYNKIKSK
jgi:ferrous iron transport protein B